MLKPHTTKKAENYLFYCHATGSAELYRSIAATTLWWCGTCLPRSVIRWHDHYCSYALNISVCHSWKWMVTMQCFCRHLLKDKIRIHHLRTQNVHFVDRFLNIRKYSFVLRTTLTLPAVCNNISDVWFNTKVVDRPTTLRWSDCFLVRHIWHSLEQ